MAVLTKKQLDALNGYRKQGRSGSRFVASWSVMLQELLRRGLVADVVHFPTARAILANLSRTAPAGAARDACHARLTAAGLAALHADDVRKLKAAQQLELFGGKTRE